MRGPAIVRLLKILIAAVIATVAVTAGFLVVVVVAAAVVAALLIRLVVRRLAPRMHRESPRVRHPAADQAGNEPAIDIVAVEKPDDNAAGSTDTTPGR